MKFRHVLFATVMAVMTVSCQKENKVVETPAADQDAYIVQLGFGGEWDVTYEPLTRANDNNDLYGIQVYSAPVNQEKTIWSYYAYGLFDNVDNVTVSLLKGYKYKFVATLIVDGKEKLRFIDGYNSPLAARNNAWVSVSNGFRYSSSDFFTELHAGHSYLEKQYSNFHHPNTERYYGELVDYIPEASSNDKAKIHLKRTSFGARFIAQGKLAKAGQLEVLIHEAPEVKFDLSEQNQHDDIYTFKYVQSAYDYQTGNYTEDIDVTINWYYQKEDGSTVTVPLGTHKITYKRNATTVVKVNLENTNVEGGIGFELDETGEMPLGDEYSITDGENVDTEIDTNH